MLRHKRIDRICCLVLAAALLLTCGVIGLSASAEDAGRTMGYEKRLFDQSRVHTIDIVMDDWEGFLATCTSEEYAVCTLVIDGEVYKNVAIRGKGNTSLSTVASYGNDRYSFKVEFDHYDSGSTYHGLDKLCLNNLIQDNTFMKDYLAYTMMGKMGVAAPLCSFVQVNVNGEAWGLYLAVESVEDAFLERNYGSQYGEVYKPDSMSFGGGRGNGRNFDMTEFAGQMETSRSDESGEDSGEDASQGWSDFSGGNMPERGRQGGMPDMGSFGGFGGFGGMGSADVKLQYIDDDPDSYANIFGNAKTDITSADQIRLISSLKALSEGDTSVVDTQSVAMYMAVHNFLCNDDSYTGNMIHNYYLYEEDGVLAMIPWDYNLAFGGFGGGSDAAGLINSPIDTLISSGGGDRPMADWITASEENLALYHAAYADAVETLYESGWISEEIRRVTEMIAPYVEKDPTRFCSYEEFERGAETLLIFCEKRFESVNGQLNGIIPATEAGQRSSDALVNAGDIQVSDMGSMGMGGGQFSFGGGTLMPDGMTMPNGMEMPGGGRFSFGGGTQMPDGMTMPDGMEMSGGGQFSFGGDMQMPGGMTFPGSMEMPQAAQTEEAEPEATDAPAETPQGDENVTPRTEATDSSDIGAARKGSRSTGGMEFQNPFSGSGAMTVDTDDSDTWRMLAICAAVLATGILFVWKFKGRY